MTEKPLRILVVSRADIEGGAARVAWNLCRSCQARGCSCQLVVGERLGSDQEALLLTSDAYRSRWARAWLRLAGCLAPLSGKVRGVGRLRCWLDFLGQPGRMWSIKRGHEDFCFPGTWRLLELPAERPDIVHCHNLHAGYFDLRVLSSISNQLPVILTLHDAWLLSGHCSHSFDCERWKTGCGHCPDLTIYPAVRRDATDSNWRRKRDIYARSRLYVATPSHWLMDKVKQSMLAPAITEARVIPNGVDLSIFHPAPRPAMRAELGIPQEARVILFAANKVRENSMKDYPTLQSAVVRVAERVQGRKVLLLALGEEAPLEQIGSAELRFIPFQESPEAVARYYQAADLYVHAARADTFPNVILEASACGTPVVATAVGGIPEQVKGLAIPEEGFRNADLDRHQMGEATGMLTPPGDAEAMAEALRYLSMNDAVRERLGRNAAHEARERFDLKLQTQAYLDWYRSILCSSATGPQVAPTESAESS